MQLPVIQPNYLNVEYLFGLLLQMFQEVLSGDFHNILHVLGVIASILAIILIAVIIYSWIRVYEINKKEQEKLHALFAVEHVEEAPSSQPENPRWEQVQVHMKSDNPSDWRLGILEADMMLDDLLDTLRIPGESLGEKLKATSEEQFPEYQKAWEAHRVRNGIAHQGSMYVLGKAEARRVLGLFEDVFKANHYI